MAESGTPRRPGRRALPAGYAIVIIAIALVVSALLNAQGIRKSVQTQPDGWKRDVGMALTRPLVSVSHALYLDRPRQELKDALGRGDDDRIDSEVVLASSPAGGGSDPTAPPEPSPVSPEKAKFSPERKLRVWVAGDSLALVPGYAILRVVGRSEAMRAVAPVDGRLATGLERPDVFNWFKYIPNQLAKLDPEVVVLAFGANDDHGYVTGAPEGAVIEGFGSVSWIAEYRRRVAGIMDEITLGGRFLVWIGVPITRDPDQSQRFAVLNHIYRTEALKRPGRVAFVDTYAIFSDENGAYSDYLEDPATGELVRMRASDGVHFDRAGGELIARRVVKEFRKAFDLTSWKEERAGAPASSEKSVSTP